MRGKEWVGIRRLRQRPRIVSPGERLCTVTAAVPAAGDAPKPLGGRCDISPVRCNPGDTTSRNRAVTGVRRPSRHPGRAYVVTPLARFKAGAWPPKPGNRRFSAIAKRWHGDCSLYTVQAGRGKGPAATTRRTPRYGVSRRQDGNALGWPRATSARTSQLATGSLPPATHRWEERRKAFRRKAVMRAVTRQPLWPGHQWKPPTRPLRVGGLPSSSPTQHSPRSARRRRGGRRVLAVDGDWAGAQPVMQKPASAARPAGRAGMIFLAA